MPSALYTLARPIPSRLAIYRAVLDIAVECQKKPGLRSKPYDNINADTKRAAAAERYAILLIFLLTSPYEVGNDSSETLITTPQLRNQNKPGSLVFAAPIATTGS